MCYYDRIGKFNKEIKDFNPHMEINIKLIEKVARNTKLKLIEEEEKEFLPQLKEILDSFSVLDEAPIENLHASFQPFTINNIFREDSVEKCLSQEEALQNTNLKKNGFFLGPKTF